MADQFSGFTDDIVQFDNETFADAPVLGRLDVNGGAYYFGGDSPVYMANDGLLAWEGNTFDPSSNILTTDDGGNYQGFFNPESQDGLFDKMVSSIKEAATTVNSILKGIVGEKNIGSLYAAAILSGAKGIMSYMGQKETQAYNDKVRQQTWDREDKLISEKYRREDEERARINAMPAPKAGYGQVAYNPNMNRNYRTPGHANNMMYNNVTNGNPYGLLGGV